MHRQFRDECAVGLDLGRELGVFGGIDCARPLARTAIVRPPPGAPRWAAASMPRARPETMVKPVRAREVASRSAIGAVGSAPARADQGNRQVVARLESPEGVKQARRVGNLGQRRRIRGSPRGIRSTPRARQRSSSAWPSFSLRAWPIFAATLGPTPDTSRRLAIEASRILPGVLNRSRTPGR